MNTLDVFLLLVLINWKHFVIDFPLQTPYQWMNKGTYGHPGGLLHAGYHGAATSAIFAFFVDPFLALALGFLDFVVHYHIDWWKMNLNKKKGWKADTHPEFWILLGFDQNLHWFTYIILIFVAYHV